MVESEPEEATRAEVGEDLVKLGGNGELRAGCVQRSHDICQGDLEDKGLRDGFFVGSVAG